MTANWWHGGMASLDTESTGVEVERDHIVEICLAIIRPAAANRADRVQTRTALINPGVPVPEEASRIHGYTTERLEAEGGDPATVLDVFAADITLAITAGLPLVIMNATFDLTMIDRCCRRLGLPTIVDRLDGRPLAPVIDPLVIDSYVVPKRRRVSDTQGARQLKTLCQVWGVGWDDDMAHAAQYDCLQAARVVWQLCQRNPEIAAMSPMELHGKQVGWRAAQQASFAAWVRSQRSDASTVNLAWPMVPYTPADEAVLTP